MMKGQGALYIGALGLMSVIYAAYAVLDMIPRVRDPEKNYLPSRIAGFTSGFILIIWICLIVIGFLKLS